MEENEKIKDSLWKKFKDELEDQLRREITQEVEEKYQKEFESWKDTFTRNFESKEKLKKQHKDQEDNMNDSMRLTTEKHVPAILQPQMKYMLPKITSMLNLKSISRLLRASSELFSMGNNGMIKAPVNMCLETYRSIDVNAHGDRWGVTYEENEDRRLVVLLYNGKALTHNQIWYIQKALWISTTLKKLSLHEFPNAEEDMWNLLDMAHVERIIDAEFDFAIDLNRFLEKYKVLKLKCRLLEKNDLFNPLFLQVDEVIFSCKEVVDEDMFLKFLRMSYARFITFQPQFLSINIVVPIIQMWLKGEARFDYVRFDMDDEDGTISYFGQIEGIRNEASWMLMESSYRSILEKRDLSIPVVLYCEYYALVIRGDGSVLLAYCEELEEDGGLECFIKLVQ